MADEAEKKDTFGEIVDRMGVKPRDLAEGDMITDIIVIVKILNADGSVTLSTCWNDGIGKFEKTGMLHVAMRGDEESWANIPREGS